MKKSEIAKGLDIKATAFLGLAAITQTMISVVNNITRVSELHKVADLICLIFVSLVSIFTYVFIIKGFSTVNKACKICEKNENYYMGRNLTVFSVICIVLSVILTFVALAFSAVISKYNVASFLSPSDIQARNNALAILVIVNIATQIFSVSTPFIVYLWKVYKLTPASEKISKFALLAVIILVVHLVISILNSMYSIRNAENNFLPDFSSILNTVKYIVLTAFLFVRRNYLSKLTTAE